MPGWMDECLDGWIHARWLSDSATYIHANTYIQIHTLTNQPTTQPTNLLTLFTDRKKAAAGHAMNRTGERTDGTKGRKDERMKRHTVVRARLPTCHSPSQTASHLASQPARQPASQPDNQPARQPASQPVIQPVNHLASQPCRQTTKKQEETTC
ncbi:hypothetical protein EJ05DRAFT_347539 [Pseudovirgaria hyperparasitica]|uniref:Uncharacterized protein n=1 Tax=Pseudovirgaria hyperparasitica TaxID=470096 RepID=A0A6A6W8V5_9PEZI|nr:uncharacterized protein EJ05DRAFT_347539 [Pseudovirgaria hyperparasitica]KAF2758326.1 hypothetical protein EJ05DRAFT_347539 [Pseudovirgaria hyperparasitica]